MKNKESSYITKMNLAILLCPFSALISSIMVQYILGSGKMARDMVMGPNIGVTGLFMKDIGEIVEKKKKKTLIYYF